MSEYQYYEFLAIDRPLSAADVRWLRGITSRAEITATRLTNTYQWGSFKGDPFELLRRCFDAHVYTSDFRTRWFMLKLPLDAWDEHAARPYLGQIGLRRRAFDDCVVLDFGVDDELDDWGYDETDDGTGWMASLAPLRAELLGGDWRCLYLTWLLDVQFDQLDEKELEPPVPAGLGQLSAACEALVDFLHIDRALLALAATQSPPLAAADVSERDWRDRLAELAPAEKDDLLLTVLMHDDAATRRRLRKRLGERRAGDAAVRGPAGKRQTQGSRTVGQLAEEWRRRIAAAERQAEESAERERKRLAESQERTRREQLTYIAARKVETWKAVESLISFRNPNKYDQAVALLSDLRDAAALVNEVSEFAVHLRELRAAHASKPSLVRRLDAAGLR